MADNLQEYSIGIEFETAINKIRKFKTVSKTMNKMNEDSMLRQIQYQKRLNALKGAGVSMGGSTPSQPTPRQPQQPQSTPSPRPRTTKNPEEVRLKALRDIKEELEASHLWRKKNLTVEEQALKTSIEHGVQEKQTLTEMRKVVRLKTQAFNSDKRITKEMKKQNFLMQRMSSSSQQFAGNMVSAFALAAGATGLIRMGQDLDAVTSSMIAVTGSSEVAAKELKFVEEQAFRLGKPLKDSAKAFARMKAAQGAMSDQNVRDIFLAVQETATAMGLSADESNRANVAIGQMMSKGIVMAQELKEQLAEAGISNAIPEMVKAAQDVGMIDKNLGLTEATQKFFKLQEQGKIISTKILPRFAERIKEVSKAGLDVQLEKSRVAMGRFRFILEKTSGTVMKSGLEKGLVSFFNTTSDLIKDNEELWKSLGKILGSFLEGVSKGIKFFNELLQAFGKILRVVTDLLGDFSGILAALVISKTLISGLTTLITLFRSLAVAMGLVNAAAAPQLLTIAAIAVGVVALIGLFEELYYFFKPDRNVDTLFGLNVNDVVSAWEGIPDFFAGMLADIKSYFTDLWDGIVEGAVNKFTELVDKIKGVFSKVGSFLREKFGNIFGGSETINHSGNFDKYNIAGMNPNTMVSPRMGMRGVSQANNTNVTLEVDGEVLAQKVVSTGAFNEGVNHAYNSYY